MANNSPFSDPNLTPLPDANDIQRQASPVAPLGQAPAGQGFEAQDLAEPHQGRQNLEPPGGENRQQLKKLFVMLLVGGLVLGAITAGGVVLLLDRLDMIGVPETQSFQPAAPEIDRNE